MPNQLDFKLEPAGHIKVPETGRYLQRMTMKWPDADTVQYTVQFFDQGIIQPEGTLEFKRVKVPTKAPLPQNEFVPGPPKPPEPVERPTPVAPIEMPGERATAPSATDPSKPKSSK